MLLTACASQPHAAARVTAHPAITSLQASSMAVRSGQSGAPVRGVHVFGTITNTSDETLRCRPTAFLLVERNGDAIAPTSQWCDVPAIAPQQSGTFSANFPTMQTAHLELRFEHPDGTYESHALTLPPA
jgi:hypothetical protein